MFPISNYSPYLDVGKGTCQVSENEEEKIHLFFLNQSNTVNVLVNRLFNSNIDKYFFTSQFKEIECFREQLEAP